MLSLQAVAEYPDLPDDIPAPPWPVAVSRQPRTIEEFQSCERQDLFLRLWQHTTLEEIGLLVWAWGQRNDEDARTPSEVVNAILSEWLIMSGGIRATDETGNVIVPGCCCGVEGWREWLDVPYKQAQPWWGHDPNPGVRHYHDGKIELSSWIIPHKTLTQPLPRRPSGYLAVIYTTSSEIVANLKQVHQDLNDFLDRLAVWAEKTVPQQAAALVKQYNQHLHIRETINLGRLLR